MRFTHLNYLAQVASLTLLTVASNAHAETWYYTDTADPMSSKMVTAGTLDSDNSLQLSFPYAGDNKGRLVIRKHPTHGTHVYMQIAKGQILCKSYNPCKLTVRFDNKPAITFSGLSSADYDPTVVFIKETNKFIAEAKNASKILIQAPIYKSGEPILEFAPKSKLTWPPK